MFTYTIYPEANASLFRKTYKALEKILNLKTGKEIVDVDGSGIKAYKYFGNDLFVICDFELEEVIVKSDISISSIIDEIKQDEKVFA